MVYGTNDYTKYETCIWNSVASIGFRRGADGANDYRDIAQNQKFSRNHPNCRCMTNQVQTSVTVLIICQVQGTLMPVQRWRRWEKRQTETDGRGWSRLHLVRGREWTRVKWHRRITSNKTPVRHEAIILSYSYFTPFEIITKNDGEMKVDFCTYCKEYHLGSRPTPYWEMESYCPLHRLTVLDYLLRFGVINSPKWGNSGRYRWNLLVHNRKTTRNENNFTPFGMLR